MYTFSDFPSQSTGFVCLFGHDGKHDNLIIAAADKNSYCNKNGTHDDCESVVAILCSIYVACLLHMYLVQVVSFTLFLVFLYSSPCFAVNKFQGYRP